MEPTDLEEVLAIELQSSWVPWTRQMFLGEILNPYAHCFVMESRETSVRRVVGFVCFRHLGEESELLNLSSIPSIARSDWARDRCSSTSPPAQRRKSHDPTSKSAQAIILPSNFIKTSLTGPQGED